MKLQKIISVNPGKNYEVIGETEITSRGQINQKVTLAQSAFKDWAALDLAKRITLLNKLYAAFTKHADQIAQLSAKEMGIPVTISKTFDIGWGLQFMRGYLDFAPQWLAFETIFENDQEKHLLFFEPRGVCAVSIPWNYPFCNFIWGVIQNLVVGNTIVFKHSEECILTAKLLGDIMNSVGLPEGVFNQVYGDGSDVGEALMNAQVDMLYFTGSTGVGKHLYQVAAKQFIPAMLELGGSAPGIVFEDVQIPNILEHIYLMRFINNGQTCDALKRLIVHKSIFNQIVDGLARIAASKKIGDPLDPSTDLGPLVSEKQLNSLKDQVADAVSKGAKVIYGGKQPKGLKGAYYEPTILTNISFDMKVWKEEVFGPALPVVSFETEEQAIALANDSEYGLGGCVYSKDNDRALRVSKQLQTGNINVNTANYVIAQDPFGGYKYSGLGREHGRQGLREFCNSKVIALKK